MKWGFYSVYLEIMQSEPHGTRVSDLKPFYRGAKITAIGAISIKKVLLMTMNDSMDGKAFEVFIEKFLVPELWVGAVVVMDNLPAPHIKWLLLHR
jgi:hypothetical protein